MLGRGCLHDSSPLPPQHWVSNELSWLATFHTFVTFSAGVIKQELSHLCDFTGDVLWTLPRVPFPFADFAVNPFAIVNH